MKIDIHYCTAWNYKPQAVSLADEFQNTLGVTANVIPGERGVFDVIVDGKLVFSKHTVGRFPQQGEIVHKIKRYM